MNQTRPEVSEAAAALGRIKSPKKAASSRRNLVKANAALTPEQRHDRAVKASKAAAKVRHENAIKRRENAKNNNQ